MSPMVRMLYPLIEALQHAKRITMGRHEGPTPLVIIHGNRGKMGEQSSSLLEGLGRVPRAFLFTYVYKGNHIDRLVSEYNPGSHSTVGWLSQVV